MRKREIETTSDKMALVAEVVRRFGVGRNEALKATMQSMRDALSAGHPGLLRLPIAICVIAKCNRPRAAGLVVCKQHRAKGGSK